MAVGPAPAILPTQKEAERQTFSETAYWILQQWQLHAYNQQRGHAEM